MDMTLYALCKKYVEKTATGLGAVKGAPCQIQKIENVENDIQVTFSWKSSTGSTETSTIAIPMGKDGKSPTITEDVNNSESSYKLVITNADGTKITTPNLKGSGSGGEGGGSVNIIVGGQELTSEDTLEFKEISSADISKMFNE